MPFENIDWLKVIKIRQVELLIDSSYQLGFTILDVMLVGISGKQAPLPWQI